MMAKHSFPRVISLSTPSYGDTVRSAKARRPRAHGPLGIAVPDSDDLSVPKWKGPVKRRAPESYQLPSIHETWRCGNRFCRQWTAAGSHAVGRCSFCQTPRGEP